MNLTMFPAAGGVDPAAGFFLCDASVFPVGALYCQNAMIACITDIEIPRRIHDDSLWAVEVIHSWPQAAAFTVVVGDTDIQVFELAE